MPGVDNCLSPMYGPPKYPAFHCKSLLQDQPLFFWKDEIGSADCKSEAYYKDTIYKDACAALAEDPRHAKTKDEMRYGLCSLAGRICKGYDDNCENPDEALRKDGNKANEVFMLSLWNMPCRQKLINSPTPSPFPRPTPSPLPRPTPPPPSPSKGDGPPKRNLMLIVGVVVGILIALIILLKST